MINVNERLSAALEYYQADETVSLLLLSICFDVSIEALTAKLGER